MGNTGDVVTLEAEDFEDFDLNDVRMALSETTSLTYSAPRRVTGDSSSGKRSPRPKRKFREML
uniref:Uncharacterized protein n=1 Tax=Anatid alphaherpesvirus 2 TaxID=3080522 RepID=A0AAU0K7D1_9ALPH